MVTATPNQQGDTMWTLEIRVNKQWTTILSTDDGKQVNELAIALRVVSIAYRATYMPDGYLIGGES